jgi:hypothetical protein
MDRRSSLIAYNKYVYIRQPRDLLTGVMSQKLFIRHGWNTRVVSTLVKQPEQRLSATGVLTIGGTFATL